MIGGKRRKIKTKTMSRKRRESISTPTEPFEIAISAVTHELLKRGFGLKRDKVADFLRQLGDSFNGSDVSKMAQICLDKFLSLDLNSCGTGVLPPLNDHVDEITLDGPFILQVGGIVELGYQLTDGVQTVDGLVVESVEGLRAHPGLKVKISNVPVTTGKLMLLPENTEVLGGGLEGCISGPVVCFGETLIDILPTMGGVSLAKVPAFKIAPCGAANVAVGISKLGGSSAVISKVGEDEFGRMLANILKLNNVNTSGMLFDSKARTTLAFVTLSADGERKFLFSENPSADMPPDESESELDLNLIKKAKVFHYGSFSLIDESCKLAHLAALRIAKDSGCILSYDPNLRLELWPSDKAAREGIMSIWDQADVIKISDDEIAFLTDGGDPYDDDAVLNKLFHPNLKLLIVTEGSDGCRYYTKDFKGIVRGINVKPVDTTAAADAFVSGILYNIASDPSIFEDEERLKNALHFSNVCGAIQATSLHYPTKDDVLQFNAKYRNISYYKM